MPRRREVPKLEVLALTAASSLAAILGRKIGPTVLTKMLHNGVPRPLAESFCAKLLQAVQRLIEETKRTHDPSSNSLANFVREMNAVVSVTEVTLGPQLHVLDMPAWPKMMRYVMFRGLRRLSGLRVLDLGACLASWSAGETVLHALATMPYLHTLSLCFDCTDNIIHVLGMHCPLLKRLDVTSSRSVTDRSVPALLQCRELQQLQLNRTSITAAGYAQLLLDLPNLQDLGRCDQLGSALEQIFHLYPQPFTFNLRKFQSRDVTLEQLRLLSKMCPLIYHISIFYDDEMTNLSILSSFHHLTEVKLLSCNFYTNCIKQLLEIKGRNLILLHLEHVDEVDLNALYFISQYCPNLKNLVLYNCDLSTHSYSNNTPALKIKPFQNLERLFCVADCATRHLEFLLKHCYSIKYIHLGSSTGINHEMLMKILAANPMTDLEELRILYGGDLSLQTVDAILDSCPNLRLLSELEGWNGISIEELQNFKKVIEMNNYDLDIRPTLSY